MKQPKIPEVNPFIIGAGGVASYLLPVLTRTFPIPRLWLRDADKLEEKNLDRQLFDPGQVGEYKASALLDLIKNSGSPPHPAWVADNRWFTEGELPPPEADLVISVADNHTARRAAIRAAEEVGIPCIIAGNEYYDSQALWVNPEDHETKYDPFRMYPEWETDTSMNPVRCTGEALVSTPQLAMANLRCASHILDLMWHHLVILPTTTDKFPEGIPWPQEIYTSINNINYIRYGR
jgi:molybdopterin/thiamine biosynthesis adenylyltransferase